MRAKDFLPDDVNQGELDGVTVRKGTVGAFLANARLLMSVDTPKAEAAVLEGDILEALPALRALGLFEIMQVRDERLRRFIDAHP